MKKFATAAALITYLSGCPPTEPPEDTYPLESDMVLDLDQSIKKQDKGIPLMEEIIPFSKVQLTDIHGDEASNEEVAQSVFQVTEPAIWLLDNDRNRFFYGDQESENDLNSSLAYYSWNKRDGYSNDWVSFDYRVFPSSSENFTGLDFQGYNSLDAYSFHEYLHYYFNDHTEKIKNYLNNTDEVDGSKLYQIAISSGDPVYTLGIVYTGSLRVRDALLEVDNNFFGYKEDIELGVMTPQNAYDQIIKRYSDPRVSFARELRGEENEFLFDFYFEPLGININEIVEASLNCDSLVEEYKEAYNLEMSELMSEYGDEINTEASTEQQQEQREEYQERGATDMDGYQVINRRILK